MSLDNHEWMFNHFTSISSLAKVEFHWSGRLLFNFLFGWVLFVFYSFQNSVWVLMERLKCLQILLISTKSWLTLFLFCCCSEPSVAAALDGMWNMIYAWNCLHDGSKNIMFHNHYTYNSYYFFLFLRLREILRRERKMWSIRQLHRHHPSKLADGLWARSTWHWNELHWWIQVLSLIHANYSELRGYWTSNGNDLAP